MYNTTLSTAMTMMMNLPMEIKTIHLVDDEELMPNGTTDLNWEMLLQSCDWDEFDDEQ